MSISIHELLAVARESEGVKAVQGDAMLCEKRFAPDTRYMVEFLVLKRKRLIFRYDRKNPRLLFSSRSTLTVHI